MVGQRGVHRNLHGALGAFGAGRARRFDSGSGKQLQIAADVNVQRLDVDAPAHAADDQFVALRADVRACSYRSTICAAIRGHVNDPATTLLRALADRSARSVGLLTAATSASASAASSSGGTSQPARNGDRGFASMKVGGPYTSHAIGGTPIAIAST